MKDFSVNQNYQSKYDVIIIGAGPVMSHYEFKQPMQDRLTDENWRNMLETNPPQRPEWASTYVS